MARPLITASSGRGELSNGRKHLNASLPRQLVFDFNDTVKKQGYSGRDAVIEELLRQYLETVAPECAALREPPSTTLVLRGTWSSHEGAVLRTRAAEHEALRVARQCAEQIIEVTKTVVMRKPPKQARRRIAAARKRVS